MNIADFKKKFPDVKLQLLETEEIISRRDIEEVVVNMTRSMGMGLIYYESRGKKIKVFTSDKMKQMQDKMVPGYRVKNKNTGMEGTVIDENLYIICGSPCVKVRMDDGYEDAYDVEFFIE